MKSIEELRAQFLGLISDYSESAYCAGWMTGIEETIRDHGGLWIYLAAACGGWPKGYRAENGWEPLTDDEKAEINGQK